MRYSHWKDLIASRPRRIWDGSKGAPKSGGPCIAARHPHVSYMAEQVDLVFLFGPEPSRDGLWRDAFAVDAVDDLVELEGRERPIDRCPRRLNRVALAAKFG